MSVCSCFCKFQYGKSKSEFSEIEVWFDNAQKAFKSLDKDLFHSCVLINDFDFDFDIIYYYYYLFIYYQEIFVPSLPVRRPQEMPRQDSGPVSRVRHRVPTNNSESQHI